MERLEMNAYSMINFGESKGSQLQLPEQIIMQAASLKRLVLVGYGIDWQLSPAFGRSLKTFSISRIPQPSMAQLLAFVSHLPFLENLSISSFGTPDEVLPSHGIEPVHMKYLQHLTISSKIQLNIVSVLKHLTFPKETIATIKISCPVLPVYEQLAMNLQEMTRIADNLTDGSILELELSSKIRCWKARPNRSATSLSPLEQPVIELDLWEVLRTTSLTTLRDPVLKSLCLDNLVRLEVKYYCSAYWVDLGSLPHLQELKIYSYEQVTITALSPTTDSHLAFPALTNLTIDSWELARNLIIASQKKSLIQGLLDCIKLRNAAHLCLERLELRDCTGTTDSVLSALQELVVDVIIAATYSMDN
ncbi:hypothetical protein H0H92_011815 [Tricholoma furcatifolium]|nr:hypothetical protein H0H92_011815 [Tricholoma furcatifolium]